MPEEAPPRAPVAPVQAHVPQMVLFQASLCYFAASVLSGPPEPPYHGRFKVSDLHLEWEKLVRAHLRLAVLSHRDSGKTYFFDFAYPIWRSVIRNHTKGRIISGSEPQSVRILGDIKREFETNPQLESYLPVRTSGNWSATRIRLRNGSTIQASGWGARVRGDHPHWMIVDDGLNDETAFSETIRRRQIEYFYNALSNMLATWSQLITVGTPFHELDLYSDLSRNPVYHFETFPAVKTDGSALCPDRYTLEQLEYKKLEIGSVRFSREFLCVPVSDEMSLFPAHLFRGEPTEQYQVRLGLPMAWWRERGIVSFYLGMDFGLSSSAGADLTSIFLVGVDVHQNRWIVDIYYERGLSYQEQQSLVVEYARRHEVALATLESNQAQRIYGTEIKRLTDLPVYMHHTGVEKHSLERGVPAMRLLLENGKYRIPRGDAASVEKTDYWISQMRSFAFDRGRVVSVAPHDDVAMASWLCEQGITKGRAFGFSMGPEEGDAEAAAQEAALDAQEAAQELAREQEDARRRVQQGAAGASVGLPQRGAPTLAAPTPAPASVRSAPEEDEFGGPRDGAVWSLNRGF